MRAALQLDLLAPPSGVVTLLGGKAIQTAGGAWQARWIGDRYGWVVYRLVTETDDDGPTIRWESWEPDLPYGQAHLYDRSEAARVIAATADRYGDEPLTL